MIDGGTLEAAVAGSGTKAVVFLHETGNEGMCGFAAYAKWLASRDHVQIVLFNRCGYGATVCKSAADSSDIRREAQPAVDWARTHGAREVTVVGASSGGMDAFEAAATVHGVTGLVDISGDGSDTTANDLALAPQVTVPALFAVAPHDQYVTVAQLTKLYKAIGSHTRRLDIEKQRPGVHGWDLLTTSSGAPSPLAMEIAAWVEKPAA
jgi:dienelactone hydrolase